MKLFLLSSALLATHVAAQDCSNTVCKNFAVHAGTTVTIVGGTSILAGDVGVSPGDSITGAELLIFGGGGIAPIETSAAFAAGVNAAHAAAMANPGTAIVEMSGQTYTPGTYTGAAAISISGDGTSVTLDAEGDDTAVFLFQAGTTLTTAANTYFNLVNGAKAENILWVLGTAATLGANSVLEGSILAGTAITFGTQSKLNGCALAQSAVTFESEGSVELGHYEADGPGNAQAGSARHLRG
jgi:hypothetical protein